MTKRTPALSCTNHRTSFVVREVPWLRKLPHPSLQKLQQRYVSETCADLPTISTLPCVQTVFASQRCIVSRMFERNPHAPPESLPGDQYVHPTRSNYELVLRRRPCGCRLTSRHCSAAGHWTTRNSWATRAAFQEQEMDTTPHSDTDHRQERNVHSKHIRTSYAYADQLSDKPSCPRKTPPLASPASSVGSHFLSSGLNLEI